MSSVLLCRTALLTFTWAAQDVFATLSGRYMCHFKQNSGTWIITSDLKSNRTEILMIITLKVLYSSGSETFMSRTPKILGHGLPIHMLRMFQTLIHGFHFIPHAWPLSLVNLIQWKKFEDCMWRNLIVWWDEETENRKKWWQSSNHHVHVLDQLTLHCKFRIYSTVCNLLMWPDPAGPDTISHPPMEQYQICAKYLGLVMALCWRDETGKSTNAYLTKIVLFLWDTTVWIYVYKYMNVNLVFC